MGPAGRQGGVLITGDHSNPRPFNADPGLNSLLNLGRALELRERFPWPPEELVIGGVISEYHQAMDAAVAGERDLPAQASLVEAGLRAASAEHHSELARAASAAGELDRVITELLREH